MEHEGQRGTVWIVEDSPLEAEMARRALASTQDTDVFADGSLALERFASGVMPDVVVLDWHLPTVSGVEVCRVIRTTHDANALPILMLTAQGQKQDIAFAIEAGANDYVTKPYDVAELVARVGTLVRTSRLQRAQVRRAKQLELAANVGAALTRSRGIPELAQRCSDILVSHFDAAFAGLWVKSGDALVLAARASRGGSAEPPESLVRECASAHAIISRAPVAAVPLVFRDEIIGVLAVIATHRAADTTAILSTIADLVALGLARAHVEAERAGLLEREQAARAEAEAANRSKDEFLAVVSHELRTPLNAITGWAAMLNAGSLDEARSRRAVETIERNARAQKQLIEDLLDVTRIVSGQLRIEKGRIDVPSIVEMALESVRLAAESKGVTITAAIEPDVPIILGDADRTQQIVWNLLTNAIKFTPAKGAIRLSVSVVADDVEIIVSDSGKGISADFLPHVFERFRQADGSVTRTSGGLGLGLAIVRHLVELHGGTIVAASEGLGRGATFCVRMPLPTAAPFVGGGRRTPVSTPPLTTGRSELDGMRVHVVDDEADARELMKALLEVYGIVVTTSANATDAYEAVRTTQPDVLLSDVAMPVEDGLSLMRRVRKLPASEGGVIPAVALTAYARAEDRESAIHAGFTEHVSKPLNASELVSVLTKLSPRARSS